MYRIEVLLALAVVVSLTAPCEAKKRHYEQLRAVLVLKAARCTSCHGSEDGAGLNDYGRKLADFPDTEPFGDRLATLEPLASPAEAPDPSSLDEDSDVDGDGVANWVEILAGAGPADRESTPTRETRDRIESVVSCRICHTANNLPGEGLQANPHNELGELLARTFALPGDTRKPKSDGEIREAAERTPILRRLARIKKKRPRGSSATYWESLRLLYLPVDADDRPTKNAIRAFRRAATLRRRSEKRPDFHGKNCPSRKLDGFLRDAKALD